MQIERGVLGVKTLGPGNRFALWVNGCHRRCPGCVSVRLQLPRPGNEQPVEEFLSGFDFSQTDGATVSGGEPFNQPEELLKLVRWFRARGMEDILVYTGFTLEELRGMGSETVDEVLRSIAVLIDGPYVRALDTGEGNLKGSDNQRILIFNEKFRPAYEAYERRERNMQEFLLDNVQLAVGIPDAAFIRRFKADEEEEGKNGE